MLAYITGTTNRWNLFAGKMVAALCLEVVGSFLKESYAEIMHADIAPVVTKQFCACSAECTVR